MSNPEFKISAIIEQLEEAHKKLSKKKPFAYTEYDLTEGALLAMMPNVKERLTPEYIATSAKYGESVLYVIIQAALQLGYNKGIVTGRVEGIELHKEQLRQEAIDNLIAETEALRKSKSS